jgi:hypothetical protein
VSTQYASSSAPTAISAVCSMSVSTTPKKPPSVV